MSVMASAAQSEIEMLSYDGFPLATTPVHQRHALMNVGFRYFGVVF